MATAQATAAPETMKTLVVLLLLLAACDRQERANRYIDARIPPAPGSDPSVADPRLVGLCLRGGAGQVVGRVVGVDTAAPDGGPAYRVQPASGLPQIAVPASDEVAGLVIPCE